MTEPAAWIKEKAAKALDPAQVERTLVPSPSCGRLTRLICRRSSSSFRSARMPCSISFPSRASAPRLARDPYILIWLEHPDVCAESRGRGRMLADLHRASDNINANNFRDLRLWKGREMLRISLREVAEVAELEETTAELSQLAEICVTQVLEYWDADLRKRLGSPNADFAVLAMGKLGGRELNHSSDIDVLFFYSEEGQVSGTLTYHQWFNRLATKVFETFAAKDPAGALFRMDLRLRPEGSAGPVARRYRAWKITTAASVRRGNASR
jgi:glutamate-ammonia-ligase adenylyltransferase